MTEDKFTEDDEISQSSMWNRVAGFLKYAAVSTGRGIQYVYRKGDENKHYVIPAVNGIIGDKLAEMKDSRAIQMSLRHQGEDISAKKLIQILKIKESRTVIVFVHGLMTDEVLWQNRSDDDAGYGPLLEKDTGAVCLYIRYNTGRHISQNGRSLSNLLEAVHSAFGPRMKSLHLIAHSMGGLVCRSAGYYGKRAGKKWIKKLSRVVLIGVPNDGSFLEKFGHLATFILKQIWNYPTRLVGRIADQRSSGIKDLRWGFLVDEDWLHEDSDNLVDVKRRMVPPLKGVHYFVILGTLTESVDSPVAFYFGDGLVGTKSAAGLDFSAASDPENYFIHCRAFTAIGHIALLTSSEVYAHLLSVIQAAGNPG